MRGRELAGFGAVACVACCAVPIVGFVAAGGLAAVSGVMAFGLVGLVLVVPVAAVYLRRRRQAHSCAAPSEPDRPVPVALRPPGGR